jgi:hypothetical protein
MVAVRTELNWEGRPLTLLRFEISLLSSMVLDHLACTTCIYLSEVHWLCLCRPSLVPFKTTKIMPVANIWKPLGTMDIELLSLVHLCISECRDRWSSRLLDTKPGLWNTVMGLLPPENSNLLSICMGKWWRVRGLKVVMLLNEDFGPCTVWHKNTHSSLLTNLGSLNFCVKHSTECGTVDKIQDTLLAKLWSNDHVWYYRNLPIPCKCGVLWHVVDLQGWPTSQILL